MFKPKGRLQDDGQLLKWLHRTECIICESNAITLEDGVCSCCKDFHPDAQISYRIGELSTKLFGNRNDCNKCCAHRNSDVVECTSLDCPKYYSRIKLEKEIGRHFVN